MEISGERGQASSVSSQEYHDVCGERDGVEFAKRRRRDVPALPSPCSLISPRKPHQQTSCYSWDETLADKRVLFSQISDHFGEGHFGWLSLLEQANLTEEFSNLSVISRCHRFEGRNGVSQIDAEMLHG